MNFAGKHFHVSLNALCADFNMGLHAELQVKSFSVVCKHLCLYEICTFKSKLFSPVSHLKFAFSKSNSFVCVILAKWACSAGITARSLVGRRVCRENSGNKRHIL